jgi:hypothetical protein
MSRATDFRPLRGALACAALLAAPAFATTIVPMRDAALVDRARLVVIAETLDRLPVVEERPATDYLMRVERVLKGEVGASTLVVRVPGGLAPDGRELKLFGAPRFQVGERALLFLGPERDGTRRVLQFMQGAFHRARLGGRDIAFRDESEVHRLAVPLEDDPGPMARDFERFAAWIADRAVGAYRWPDYLFQPEPAPLQALTEDFTFFESEGLNLRWFTFDSSGSVTWKAHRDGQPGLASGGFPEFQRALTAWNNESATPIKLNYGGTTSAAAGFQSFDSQNVLLFNDPNNDIEGKFDCSAGGTLAIGGPWSDPNNTGNFNGKRYIRIAGADIVMNDGIECRLQNSSRGSKMAEEVYAHELGHGLGLGHSSENAAETNQTLRNALMYFRAHDDNRGARLESDDIAGIRVLYQKSGSGGGGGGNPACPAGTLCLLAGRFQVTVTWQNQFNGASGTGGAIPSTDLAGFFYFDDPGNIELIVKILDFGTEIKVFYSQLTNLRFTMTVRDTRGGTTKTYSNTTGECGAIDHGAFASALASPGLAATDAPLTADATAGTCRQDVDTLCLLNNRFAIEVTWRNQFDGSTGVGRQKKLSDLTGAFSFSDPSNLEILIKTLDFGDKILAIYGSLSNFEYAIRVTDTITGQVKTYQNAAGNYCGGIDENAFPPA